jgi:uncharacterized protein YggT (Ycf19 family)
MPTRIILTVFNLILYIYIFLVTIRIVFSWFRPNIDSRCRDDESKLWHYLCLITGPFLALFSRFKNLRTGSFDYTPIIAVFTLLVASQVTGLLRLAGHASIANLILAVFLGIWEAFQIILFFSLFLCVIRILGLFIRNRPFDRFLDVIDLALQPFVAFILTVSHRKLSYQAMLFICIVLISIISIAVGFSLKPFYRDLFMM